MPSIVESAPAKLNLALHVRARRADGYHELETLFAFVRDGDLVTLAPAERDSFSVVGPFAAALTGDDPGNLVLRARDVFAGEFGALPPLAITLDKRLPVASGIGGGSADAAATLRALARLRGVPADSPMLMQLAARLGADVPACLLGRTALGQGRGDMLREVPGAPWTPVLLVNPGVAVSTAAVFARWDGVDRGALPAGDAMAIARTGRNDLEAPACAVAPVIAEVLALLSGAEVAHMSGSGATCFALFADERARSRCAAAIRHARPEWWHLETELT